jgi:hypothetical protein
MTFGRKTSMLAVGAMALAFVAPGFANADAPSRLVGTIADFHGKYGVVVRDAAGRIVPVQLHQGTVIKPVGLRLERGMQVTVVGQAADGAFAAGEIDTAYSLPPPRAPQSPPALGAPKGAPYGLQPVADNGRFNNVPGDLGAPRVPDIEPRVVRPPQ